MKFRDSDLKNYSLMKSKKLDKCFVCQEGTYYIDYCCEGRVCSTECHDKFYEELTNDIKKKD